MMRPAVTPFLVFSLLAAAVVPARAADACPGRPDALGTARVLPVDVTSTPRVGRKHFAVTLPLKAKELVLTFDDGPWPTTTPLVLDALKAECVRATFFLLGEHAEEYATIARRELAEGHTVAHHTYAHPLLDRLPLDKAAAEIARGIQADEVAVYGQAHSTPATPFFRFPGFASSPALLDLANARGLVVFGADVWASDWNPMSPDEQLRLILGRIDQVGRGIVLFHDTKSQTAHMLPAFLRELKRRGYSIVHVIPSQNRAVSD